MKLEALRGSLGEEKIDAGEISAGACGKLTIVFFMSFMTTLNGCIVSPQSTAGLRRCELRPIRDRGASPLGERYMTYKLESEHFAAYCSAQCIASKGYAIS
jgi:hypothetical protein